MSDARRFCFCFVILSILLFSPYAALSQGSNPILPPVDPLAPVATLVAPDVSTGVGGSTLVEVKATDVSDNIVGIQGSFSFDPTVFIVTEFSFNEAFAVTSVNVLNEQGLVRFVATLVMDTDDPIGMRDGTLFSFTGQATGVAGDVSPIDLNFLLVKNMEHIVIPIRQIDGSFTIIGDPIGNLPPIAEFTYLPNPPKANEKINFTDLSTDPDGFIVNWLWDFGDGNTLEVQTASAEPVMHTYVTGGSYNVKLTVTDNLGATDMTTKIVSMGPEFGGPDIYVFPNPCRTICNFKYIYPPDTSAIDLRIYNIRGELVRSVGLDLATNLYQWNMRDDFGNRVPNGPYFFVATFVTGQGIIRTPIDVLVVKR
jgi:PKD repeat protein